MRTFIFEDSALLIKLPRKIMIYLHNLESLIVVAAVVLNCLCYNF